MTERTALARLLLDMLGTARPVDPATLAALSEDEWDAIGAMAKQHRLAPLLHHRIGERGGAWPIPDMLKAHWALGWRAANVRALAVQQALTAVGTLADGAGLPHAALKGAWLAWQAYPHPALRPMRDIDLLLSEDDALRLHALMAEAGAVPGRFSHTPIAYARAHHKHLPPLHWGPRRVAFELHWRLTNPREGEDRDAVAARTEALLARRVRARTGAAEIVCLDPTDTLLHLIVHGAYGRQPFDTGPMLLTDIAAAVRAAAIDWPRFWAEAAAGGWTGGARLILALTAKYMGPVDSADPDPAPVPEALVATAEALMLQDMDARAERGFATHMAEAKGAGGRTALLWRRAFPPRHIVAQQAGVAVNSWRVWPAYPLRLADHARQWLRRRGDSAMDAEVSDMRAMRAWLGTGG
ncbi:MAG TPA: nucleotidyltransferase family protein [Sphingopyxis sp.]|nr:nucleotidyltransferase family protein [Sphingopyxis sp.]HMP45955.1 nucleotidyltransferase family protein [Sphingopyxis sp.]HMQ19960.1 nucleotidyltransferase family protein [Sphingopyxis sp.]